MDSHSKLDLSGYSRSLDVCAFECVSVRAMIAGLDW